MGALLTILIATIDDGIISAAEMLLPQHSSVHYLFSWQRRKDFKHNLRTENAVQTIQERPDATLLFAPSTGISANRNHCLQHWQTPFALIADDDMHYTQEQLLSVIDSFTENPAADILCFQVTDEDGAPLHSYPAHSFDYANRPKGYFICSVEIALKKGRAFPAFDERFGLGAPYLCAGEEEVFIHQCHLQGHQIQYIPFCIGTTKNIVTTSVKTEYTAIMRRTKGAVLRVIYGRFGGLLRLLKTAFLPPHRHSFRWMKDFLQGFFYIKP